MSLAEQIRAIERRFGETAARCGVPSENEERSLLPTGWNEIDVALGGGLTLAALHEWFGVAPSQYCAVGRGNELRRDMWQPALLPLVHLVRQVMNRGTFARRAVWIGRCCFPYGSTLMGADGDRRLLERSVFVAADKPADRLWAVDLALRSAAVGVVIADGSGFDMAATRRIQLVAKAQHTPAFLARPPWELCELSAAQTRWLVRWEASCPHVDAEWSSFHPQWSVELLRCKSWSSERRPRVWGLEWDGGEGVVRLSTTVVRPAGDAGASTIDHQLRHA